MRTIGAHINTTESVILSLVGDASHSNFKEIQRIIKNVSPDTELVLTTSFQDSIVSAKGSSGTNVNGATNIMQSSL